MKLKIYEGRQIMTNRQIAAAQTRKRLVEAAKNIICDKGLTNTSIDEITEACGVSKGTFYTYFKRKEDVVYELSERMFDEIFADAQGFEGTIIEKLENYMIHFSRYIECGSLKLAQEWIKNVVDSDISDVGTNKLKKDTSAVKELIRSGIENKELRTDSPVEQISNMINDLLYGQMLCWALNGGEYSFEKRTQIFCETYLNVLLKQYLL